MFRPTRLLTTYCAHTKQDQSVRFVPLLLYENSVLLNHKVLTTQSILPPPPSFPHTWHVICTNIVKLSHTEERKHTHSQQELPRASMWQAAVRVPRWCRQRFFTQVHLSKHTLTLLQQESSASSFHITASLSQIYIYTLLLPTPPTHTLFFPGAVSILMIEEVAIS